jgi:sulfatase modifying factor 1
MKKTLFTLTILLANFLTSYAQSYPEMIIVEGGTFIMGNSEGIGDKDEQPAHEVTLSTFKIAKTETTVDQWKTFCDATGRNMPQAPKWGWLNTHPIVNVSYDDVTAYCEWLSKKRNAVYRLPTEAEWEYAARGGNKSKGYLCSGSDDVEEVAWYSPFSLSIVTTQAVKQFEANELGIFDMSGNVWEWCLDWHGSYTSTKKTNSTGPSEGKYRVLRGGGFYSGDADCRVANRRANSPSSSDEGRGFRVVVLQ